MVKSEWYTNRTWNGAIDGKFEKYLKHTRDTANKAEFMQIQGALLLDNSQPNVQNVGVALLTRVIEDFSTEHTSVVIAQEKLGEYYLKQHDYKQAQYFLRIVYNYCKQQNSRSGTGNYTALKLAEALLKLNDDTTLQEAYQLVSEFDEDSLKLIDIKFYHASLAANICDALNKSVEAIAFAKAALAMPVIIKPAFKQKIITPAKFVERNLRSLQEIIAPSTP